MIDAISVGDLSTHGMGSVLEHFRDSEHAPLLWQLAAELSESELAPSALEVLLNDTLTKLQSQAITEEINELTARERSGGLDVEGRHRLAALLRSKQQLRAQTK
jgi:hypothetical protein